LEALDIVAPESTQVDEMDDSTEYGSADDDEENSTADPLERIRKLKVYILNFKL